MTGTSGGGGCQADRTRTKSAVSQERTVVRYALLRAGNTETENCPADFAWGRLWR